MEDLARLLAGERKRVRLSQLQLSLRMNVSQRHVSFVESRRARPSRELILAWIRETESGPSTRNAALLLAGYAPRAGSNQSAPGAAAIRNICRLLEAHDPFPALVFDAEWRIRRMNEGARRLCSHIMPEYIARTGADPAGIDMIDGCTASDGLLSVMEDGAAFGRGLARQVRQEAHARPGLLSRLELLDRSLDARFGRPPAEGCESPTPSLGASFKVGSGLLRYVTAQSIVALPQDVTLMSPRIEFWFPLDEATRRFQSAPDDLSLCLQMDGGDPPTPIQ